MLRTCIENKGSRFADPEEIKKIAVKVNCRANSISAGGAPVLSDGVNVHVLNHDCHTCICGASGSKKSRNGTKPQICLCGKHGESMVINDPKGELYKKTKRLLEKNGYSIHVLNFRDPGVGSRYNLLSLVYKLYKEGQVDKSDMLLRDIAQCIYSQLASNCNDIFWTSQSEDYFVGLAQILRDEVSESAFTIENIRLAHSLGSEKFASATYLHGYCEMLDRKHPALANLSGTIHAPNETKLSIMSVFSQPLSLYSQNNLCDMLMESDFELSDIGKERTAIFLITPDERSIYNPIITAFIKLCYGTLIDLAESKECGGMLPVRVNFILDEFSNLPPIPDFNSMISAARSRNIRFSLVVQSLAQLYKAYSESTAENILTNCEAWYVFRSNDYALHERLRVMCGTYISEHSYIERPLVDTMTIQRLDKERGEVLIKIQGQYAFVTELPDIDKYDFGMPLGGEVTYMPRKPKERERFDIREATKRRKRELIFKSMNIPVEVED